MHHAPHQSELQLNPAQWFNPRRRRNVEKLIWWLRYKGTATIGPDAYHDLEVTDLTELDRYQVDQAADDGFVIGVFDMTMTAHGWMRLELLSDDIDRRPTVPASVAKAGESSGKPANGSPVEEW